MVTYSGIVVITGSGDTDFTGIFPVVSFDTATSRMDALSYNVLHEHTEVAVLTTSDLVMGGSFGFIGVEANGFRSTSGYNVGHVHTEVSVINPPRDLRFSTLTASSGIIVIDYGPNIVGGYVAIPRTNARFFPTPVSTATLFPGDKPRGQPLN